MVPGVGELRAAGYGCCPDGAEGSLTAVGGKWAELGMGSGEGCCRVGKQLMKLAPTFRRAFM